MIYLIKSLYCPIEEGGEVLLENTKYCLKIGYTENTNKRFAAYTTHNIAWNLIITIEGGDQTLESALHKRFKKYKINNEWFEYNEEILDFFRKNNTVDLIIEKLKKDLGEDFLNYSITDSWKNLKNLDRCIIHFIKSRISSKFNFKELASELYQAGAISDEKIISYLLKKYQLSEEDFLIFRDSINNNSSLSEALNAFNSVSQFPDKMKVLCDNPEILEYVPFDYSNYFYALGPDRIKACQYRKYILDNELVKIYSVQGSANTLSDTIYLSFIVGQRYTKSEIKEKLKTIYEALDIKLAPKALILKDYFDTKDVLMSNKETGKRDNGFLILKQKEQ